jgi:hypothetical protein
LAATSRAKQISRSGRRISERTAATLADSMARSRY